jgi:preprotein translocase subunit SecA
MNDQRKVIFDQRIEWMRDDAVNEIVADMRHAAIEDLVARHLADATLPEQWDVGGLDREVRSLLTLAEPLEDWAREEGMTVRELRARLTRAADRWIAAKDEKFGAAGMRHMQRLILLHALDTLWREHLLTLDDLRRAVGLRRYARRQPLVEYKTEAFHLFETMLRHLNAVVTALSMRVGIVSSQAPAPIVGRHDQAYLEG